MMLFSKKPIGRHSKAVMPSDDATSDINWQSDTAAMQAVLADLLPEPDNLGSDVSDDSASYQDDLSSLAPVFVSEQPLVDALEQPQVSVSEQPPVSASEQPPDAGERSAGLRDVFLRKPKPFTVVASCFVVILVIIGMLAVVLPKAEISGIENRALAKLPEFSPEALASGSYANDLALFFSDTFPLREQFIGMASGLRYFFGLHGADDVTLFRNTQSTTEAQGSADDQSAEQADDFVMNPKSDNNHFFDEPRDVRSNIVVIGDTALSLYGYYQPAISDYAQTINDFAQRYAGKVKTSVLVVPLYCEFRLPEQYRDLSDDQYSAISEIYLNLDANVNKVQVYNTLAEHIEEYIYFRTDHHWTALGAWYAYRQYVESLGLAARQLSDYEEINYGDFLGSLYNQIGGDAKMAANPDQLIAYQPPLQTEVSGYNNADLSDPVTGIGLLVPPEEVTGSNMYMAFGYEYAYKKITTNSNTGRKLIVFRESFANAMIPFLAEQYDELHIIDFRYFSGDVNKLISDNGITDALFINNMSSAGSDMHVWQIKNMLGLS
jgi:hypothetical protein